MKVLGVHSLTHDLSATLSIDGNIRYAVEEERLSRIKHHPGIEVEGNPPYKSIEWILRESGISLKDLDLIVHAGWSGDNFMKLDIIRERFRKFAKELDPKGKKTLFVDHHRAHAASAFYGSGFESGLVLAIDGCGDWISTSIYIGKGSELKKVDEYFFDQSLGFMYSRAARLLGLGDFGFGEGKLTALAAYGKPIEGFPSPVVLEQGRYRMVDRYYENNFVKFKRRKEKKLSQRQIDFGATVQSVLEKTIIYILSNAAEKYREDNLAIGGGVGLNCKLNGLLRSLPWVKNMYVQPAANDAGLSIGAAYLGAKEVGDNLFPMRNIFLGPTITTKEVERYIQKNGLRAEYVQNPSTVAAELINDGQIVAWMQGNLELGPRALGHRSLLGDPRSLQVKDRLNVIKQRELWRPVAPAIIESKKEYCNLQKASEYMTNTIKMTELAVREIPGGLHIDNSARVQLVRKNTGRFYDLIRSFERITCVPAVLNTSLNSKNEPICTTVEDGIKFFFTTPTDSLIIDHWKFKK